MNIGPRFRPSYLDLLIRLCLVLVVFFLPLSLDVATGFLAAGSLVWFGKMLLERSWQIGRLPFDHILAMYVVIACLSVAASPDRVFSLYNFGHLMGRYVLLYYFISHNLRTLDLLKKVVAALLASTIIVVLYGFYQYIVGVDISAFDWVDTDQFPDLKVRVFSTLQNPNLLAGFLVTMIAIVIGLGLSLSDPDARLSLLVMLLALAGCLTLTYSRGAWVSLVVVIGAYGLFRDKRILWLLLLAPLAALCFSDVSSRLASILQPVDSSAALRLALWESTLAMIADHPLSGIGWGAYWLVYPHYNFFIQDPSTLIFHAHNMYLHLAAEVGLPGLAAFIAFMFCHARTAVSLLHQPAPAWVGGLLTGLAAAILGLAINGLTDHILFSIQMSMLFWLLLAVVIAIKQVNFAGDLKNSLSVQQENSSLKRNT